jgi:hypothetical protein
LQESSQKVNHNYQKHELISIECWWRPWAAFFFRTNYPFCGTWKMYAEKRFFWKVNHRYYEKIFLGMINNSVTWICCQPDGSVRGTHNRKLNELVASRKVVGYRCLIFRLHFQTGCAENINHCVFHVPGHKTIRYLSAFPSEIHKLWLDCDNCTLHINFECLHDDWQEFKKKARTIEIILNTFKTKSKWT